MSSVHEKELYVNTTKLITKRSRASPWLCKGGTQCGKACLFVGVQEGAEPGHSNYQYETFPFLLHRAIWQPESVHEPF